MDLSSKWKPVNNVFFFYLRWCLPFRILNAINVAVKSSVGDCKAHQLKASQSYCLTSIGFMLYTVSLVIVSRVFPILYIFFSRLSYLLERRYSITLMSFEEQDSMLWWCLSFSFHKGHCFSSLQALVQLALALFVHICMHIDCVAIPAIRNIFSNLW